VGPIWSIQIIDVEIKNHPETVEEIKGI